MQTFAYLPTAHCLLMRKKDSKSLPSWSSQKPFYYFKDKTTTVKGQQPSNWYFNQTEFHRRTWRKGEVGWPRAMQWLFPSKHLACVSCISTKSRQFPVSAELGLMGMQFVTWGLTNHCLFFGARDSSKLPLDIFWLEWSRTICRQPSFQVSFVRCSRVCE